MSTNNQLHNLTSHHDSGQGSVFSYVIGFISSIALTLIAYYLVVNHILQGWQLIGAIIGLAVIQLLVQLFCFLHLGRESKPRWNLFVLLFAALIVLIVVIGSLWIMNNLNYRMMSSPTAINQYLHKQGDF